MWRGAIAFGLVNIGVRLYAATEDHDYHFHQLHRQDNGRIQHKRVCSECGQEVDVDDMVKGYETSEGKLVVLDSEDFQQLPIRSDHAIDLLQFVSVDQVDPVYFQKSYYLAPDKAAMRPYGLLRTALERTGTVALVKITMRQRETLATIRVRDDVLTLHTMLWPDEIRSPDFGFLQELPELRSQELDMATSLVENMSDDFDPDAFEDDYRQALNDLIEAKSHGAEPAAPPEKPEEGEVIDLETALSRSLTEARNTKTKAGKPTRPHQGASRSSSKQGSSSKRSRAKPQKRDSKETQRGTTRKRGA